MVKEKQEPYKFLGNLVVVLMDSDNLFTYNFFEKELSVSSKTVSELKRGEDKYVRQYVSVIGAMMESLNLTILMDVLMKQLRMVLSSNCDLVVATIPHRTCGNSQPKEWVVVIRWEGVRA